MDRVNVERQQTYAKSLKDQDHQLRGQKLSPYRLSDVTAARIAAISRSFRPYRNLRIGGSADSSPTTFSLLGGFLNITAPLSTADYLEDRIQSPERAQLFVALQTTRVSFENIGRNADFSFVVLDKLDLSNSDFRTVRMRNSVLSESNIAYTTFKDGVFSGSDFTGARGLSNNFTGCDLTNADFSQALVNNSNFSNALLQGGRFNNANLIQAVFAGPLENASFEGANLDGANFRDVTDVENAAFGNALIERLNAPPELIEQLKARGATSDFSVWRDRTEANWLP